MLKKVTLKKNELMMNYVLEGINEAFSKENKQFDGLIRIPDYYKNSYGYLNEYFTSHQHKVVITLRDSQATAVLNACSKNGIRIPEDTDLICVIDSRYNEMVRPTISSFDNPAYDLGALAMRVMTKMLSGEQMLKKEYPLSCPYRGKDSTKL